MSYGYLNSNGEGLALDVDGALHMIIGESDTCTDCPCESSIASDSCISQDEYPILIVSAINESGILEPWTSQPVGNEFDGVTSLISPYGCYYAEQDPYPKFWLQYWSDNLWVLTLSNITDCFTLEQGPDSPLGSYTGGGNYTGYTAIVIAAG